MPITALAYASGTLTSDATDVANDATQAIGGKTYTFKASGASADGEVNKGVDAAGTLANLKAAINLDGTAGAYGASMTQNPYVIATAVTATVLTLKSRVPGAIGNLILIGTAPTHLTRSGAAFTGGTGSMDTAISQIRDTEQLNAAVEQILLALDGTPNTN